MSGCAARSTWWSVTKRAARCASIDHKTGKAPDRPPVYVGGGTSLQPLLYALAAEAALGERVESSQLSYCTQRGNFQRIEASTTPSARLFIGRALEIIDLVPARRIPARRAAGRRLRCLRLPPGLRSARTAALEEKEAGTPRAAHRAKEHAVTPQPASQLDADARRVIRESLDESLIVEASAGTGKTTELVARIVQVLAKNLTTVDKIVAVTFTHKAAGELKIRLRQELDKARALATDAGERDRLEEALKALEEAAIGTIHGFCAQILRQRPVEAGVDPAFEELTEQESSRIFDRAFNQWFQRKLGESSPGLRRALSRLAWRDSWESGPAMEQLRMTGRKLVEWRDFPHPWRRRAFDREAAVMSLLAQIRELAAMAAQAKRANDNLAVSLRPVQQLLTWLARTEGARRNDYDSLESLLLKLQRDLKRDTKKGSGPFSETVRREDVLARRELLLQALEDFRVRAGADLAAELRAEMQDLIDGYQAMKAHVGKLDFLDLLLLACELLRTNANVREYFQQRFSHMFVDEFQDTDPLQAEILLLLAADDPAEADWLKARPAAGKLFLVGDPKQSIYKFRRADVTLYQRVCAASEKGGVRRINLTRSHRSVLGIQQFVNAAFATEMTGDEACAQAMYSAIEEDGPHRPDQPSVIALPAPRPYGSSRISKDRINACLPDAIGAFIDWLVNESGWKVRGPDGAEWIPVAARHVCILFRRFTNWGLDMTRDYVKALESRGLPHLLVGSKSFHHREEVETLRTALTAIEWPEDELSVFATLRGSLFAISDGLLLRFRQEFHRLHPFRKYPETLDPDFRDITDALDLLADSASRAQPPADRRYGQRAARIGPRPRRIRHASHRPPGARQCVSHLRSRAHVRIDRRDFLPRVRRGTGRASGKSGLARSAGARGGGRRRAPDDGAHRQGPRISGSRSWPT